MEEEPKKAHVKFKYQDKEAILDVTAGESCNCVTGGFDALKANLGISCPIEALYLTQPDGTQGDLCNTKLKTEAGKEFGPVEIKVRQRKLVTPQKPEEKQLMGMVGTEEARAYYMPQDKEEVLGIYGGKYKRELAELFQEELTSSNINTPVLVMPGASVGKTGDENGYDQATSCPVIILQVANLLKIWVPPLGNDDTTLSYPKDPNFSTIPITCQGNIILFSQGNFKAAMKFPGQPIDFMFGEETEAFKALFENVRKNNLQTMNQNQAPIMSNNQHNNNSTPVENVAKTGGGVVTPYDVVFQWEGTDYHIPADPHTTAGALCKLIREKLQVKENAIVAFEYHGKPYNETPLEGEDPAISLIFTNVRKPRIDVRVLNKLMAPPYIDSTHPNLPGVNTNLPGVNANLPGVNANLPGVNANIPGVNANLPGVNANLPVFNAINSVIPNNATRNTNGPIKFGAANPNTLFGTSNPGFPPPAITSQNVGQTTQIIQKTGVATTTSTEIPETYRIHFTHEKQTYDLDAPKGWTVAKLCEQIRKDYFDDNAFITFSFLNQEYGADSRAFDTQLANVFGGRGELTITLNVRTLTKKPQPYMTTNQPIETTIYSQEGFNTGTNPFGSKTGNPLGNTTGSNNTSYSYTTGFFNKNFPQITEANKSIYGIHNINNIVKTPISNNAITPPPPEVTIVPPGKLDPNVKTLNEKYKGKIPYINNIGKNKTNTHYSQKFQPRTLKNKINNKAKQGVHRYFLPFPNYITTYNEKFQNKSMQQFAPVKKPIVTSIVKVPVGNNTIPVQKRPLMQIVRSATMKNIITQTPVVPPQVVSVQVRPPVASAPRPVTAPRPVIVKVPMQTVQTVPAQPPVASVPVAPVPQGTNNQPRRKTYYHRGMMCGSQIKMTPIPIQNISNDNQYIQLQNQSKTTFNPGQIKVNYQYCDEFGRIFSSDSPIYRDIRNNSLVTFGNGRYI